MMLRVEQTTQFRRDIRKLQKQGKDLKLLFSIIKTLADQLPLSPQYRNHPLTGNWRGYQECHIRLDWLLIYRIEENILYLARSGSHADLF